MVENTENEDLKKKVEIDSPLKEILVNYVGNSNENVKNEEVTVENIVETLAMEFPEFLMVVAEENWIRGYHQALNDVEEGEKIAFEQTKSG